MHKLIKEAMRANSFYHKARNFKELWELVDGMIDWRFHKMIAKELKIAWYEIDSSNALEVTHSFNSYNSCSSFTFLLKEVKWGDIKFLALCFHLGGDVRRNYGDLIFINREQEDFLIDLAGLTLEFVNSGFCWTTYPFVGESGMIYDARAYKRSDRFNAKLEALNGFYHTRYPKGFITAYEKTCVFSTKRSLK